MDEASADPGLQEPEIRDLKGEMLGLRTVILAKRTESEHVKRTLKWTERKLLNLQRVTDSYNLPREHSFNHPDYATIASTDPNGTTPGAKGGSKKQEEEEPTSMERTLRGCASNGGVFGMSIVQRKASEKEDRGQGEAGSPRLQRLTKSNSPKITDEAKEKGGLSQLGTGKAMVPAQMKAMTPSRHPGGEAA